MHTVLHPNQCFSNIMCLQHHNSHTFYSMTNPSFLILKNFDTGKRTSHPCALPPLCKVGKQQQMASNSQFS